MSLAARIAAAVGRHALEVHNRDIFPPHELVELYRDIGPIVVNPVVDNAFRRHEAAAVVARRTYHQRGRIGMVLVLLSALFTVAMALILPHDTPPLKAISIVVIFIGAGGLSIQIHQLLTGQKKLWLMNRFAAERIRSIKFQAYQLAAVARSREDLQARADAFYTQELGHLNAELNAGAAALTLFSPSGAFADLRSSSPPANGDLSAIATDAYRELRIEYQRRFAAAEIQKLGEKQRVHYAWADILYLAGVALTVAALVCKLIFPHNTTFEHWIDFLAVGAFIGGLLRAIIDNASLADTSKGRYENYIKAIEDYDRELNEDGFTLAMSVRQVERIVLGELGQFCEAASHITYRL
ncbi:MAG: hypothetical protein JWO83_3515 [Caulobacteraceae bacterium]|nr:hypothetical protein [Caulobacteraceae bacterium]